MSNEITGRLHNIGLGLESVAGTAVSASSWLPKVSGVFMPKFTTVRDPAGYGVIDGVKEVQTTTIMTQVEIEGIIRDIFFGHILAGAFGAAYDCVRFPISGGSGTFTEGETITESTSSATGVLRRSDQGAGTPALYIDPATGTFTGGQTLTGGTSGATTTGGTIISPSTGKHHIFRRANTNTHASYTLYGKDAVGDERAAYCLLDSLEIDVVVGEYATFKATYMGKSLSSTSSTASYTAQNPFLAKFATFKHASAFNSLDAASATAIKRLHLTIEKNVVPYIAFGSTTATSIHNQEFLITGDMELLYNESSTRDYLTNGTTRAMRLTIANTGATAVSGSTYPTVQFDLPVVGFEEWERSKENAELVTQTVGFVATMDLTRSMSGEGMIISTQTSAYL